MSKNKDKKAEEKKSSLTGFKDKIVILGAGESGVGTAILATQKGYDVFVSDSGTITNKHREVLLHNEIRFEERKHTKEDILDADIAMKSPGIPDKVSIVQGLYQKGITVISEIEFAAQFTDAMIVGITGSNGKTTTTLLTHHILKNAGLNVGIAGNIGQSFARQVAENTYENYVLELSSFQLDGMVDFVPHIAIITNISPDHLDRYEYKFEKYINAKCSITKNQTASDYLIYDADDEAIKSWLKKNKIEATLLPFSIEKKVIGNGAYLKDKNILIKTNSNNKFIMDITALALQGNHNVKNAMASGMVAKLLGIRNEVLRESLENFDSVEHRLEPVFKINGVQYINDSKATNVNATFYALDSMETPTIWIVGGTDKGNDYTELLPLVREKVKAIICLGLDNTKIIETFGNVVDFICETAGAEEAVKVAYKISEKGDTVLLSPACASFDLFENYEDRGRQFKEAVRML